MGDKITNNSVELTVKDGIATIEQGTALTRLHYFDGKFLRADALTLEQDYHRALVRLSNLAGGWGVVHGLGISLASEQLSVTPGLAITPAGSTVLLSNTFTVAVSKLVDSATAAPTNPSTPGVAGSGNFGNCDCDTTNDISTSATTGYYEITVGPVEGLCGNEEVYGKLCEDACVTDSQSPYWKEGLVLRLRPINLNLSGSSTVLPNDANLRNRVASAYFASEPWLTASLLSSAGLNSPNWCNPAMMYNRDEVPIGLLVRNGSSTQFIDAWSARRERMDTQARGYWQGRMMMRPWNVFLAQILQFQCQLSGVFKPGVKEFDPMDDDCKKLRALLGDSLRELEKARKKYAEGNKKILGMLGDNSKALEEMESPFKSLETLASKLSDAQDSLTYTPQNRMLINAGFVELPPAGYLPVVPGKTAINEQLQRMFGEGVNLHFCTARPDFIPHAVEEDQHMQRISLTRGLDNPAQKEDVEIFVPDGQIIDALGTENGTYWFAEVDAAFFSSMDISFGKKAKADIAEQVKEEAANATVEMANNGTAEAVHEEMLKLEREKRSMTFNREKAIFKRSRPLQGIARTSRLDSGGAAITILCKQAEKKSIEAYEAEETNTLLLEREFKMYKPQAPETHTSETGDNLIVTHGRGLSTIVALYIDLRTPQSPFSQKEGDEIAMSFEQCAIVSRIDDTTGEETLDNRHERGTATLSIDSVDAINSSTVIVEGTVRIGFGSDGAEFPVRFKHEGSPQNGHFSLQVGDSDTAFSHVRSRRLWSADWSGQPRDAVFGLEAQSKEHLYYETGYHAEKRNYLSGYNSGSAYTEADNNLIKPLLTLRESETPFKPESTVRLSALNTLADMADILDDAAFLPRARGRLFPDANTSSNGISVRATQDWVMFRRQRKAICDTNCQCETPVNTDSYKTWHLKLDDIAELEILQKAIDHNQLETLKGRFNFKTVDVLHYEDASLSPTEKTSQIRDDWEKANPGQTVLLGRVWETLPDKGQGAQNNLRLKRLVKLLSGIIDMPGVGVIRAMVKPPQKLKDSQFDGGMLLVTADKTADTLKHRVYIVSAAQQQEISAYIQSGAKVYEYLEKYAIHKENLDIEVQHNTPDASEVAALKTYYDDIHSMDTTSMVVISKSAANDADAKTQFHNICVGMAIAEGIPGASSFYRVADNDFGTGIEAATVVYYNVEDK